MKRTEIERKERELKKFQKKVDNLQKDTKNTNKNVNSYINELFSCFLYDEKSIFNTKSDIKILEILEEMKENIPEKQWDNILKNPLKKLVLKIKTMLLKI